MTTPSNRALVGDALDALFRALLPYVEERMEAVYGEEWVKEARRNLRNKPPDRWDVSDLFTLIYFRYAQAFRSMGHRGRSWVSILKEVRKKWAHQAELSLEETRRALEIVVLVLEAIGAHAEADRFRPRVRQLMEREVGTPAAEGQASAETGREENIISRGLKQIRRLTGRAATEPLEIRRDLLDAVERAVRPHARGKPFNRIIVHLLAPDGAARAAYEAALAEQDEPFEHAVRRRLSDARLPVPKQLNVSWKMYGAAPQRLSDAFQDAAVHVELQRRIPSTYANLSVLRGEAARGTYTFKSGSTVTIGRLREVLDEKGRLIRRNVVAFADYELPELDDEMRRVLQTVSRAHASIRYDPANGVFRVFDEQSTWGTSVVREGYPVPIQVKQQPVPLEEGDLIYVGKACLRFRLGKAK